MSTSEVYDKHGKPIQVGDIVSSKARGGKQTGEVTAIDITEEDAKARGVTRPPKVLYTDQHGHSIAHNPGTLVHGEDPFDK
ncbi:hypothetical protein AMATHDRAFT_147760 [Amanita thiersii Skay4041]|uniref:Hypervirulence associated protein TUDOR domain-containing protein n=1 Tax=Amanita thiersii Skay4041 TaxID=703135 RepID=A0A2A9NJ71_9AGAR|nr:hypothetical protein AMATHDRAFT_147760 [Amanita thiersii Skay4041]